ncbi:MAG: hypothetical protein JNK82_00315, partial [Myxococcaceae bacterium]|nr:hypothetical protein [Myxococcaceae bacterium]
LGVGLVLVRTLTPVSEYGEGEPVAPSVAPVPRPQPLAGAATDAGRELPRVSQNVLAARLPPYPGAGKWVHIGDTLDTNGVPMAMASFETKDGEGRVLEHYARYFDAAGFPWQGVEESLKTTGLAALSASDVVNGLQLSVVVFGHEGGTTVVLSAADMTTFYERVEGSVNDDGDLPSYPGAKPMVMRASDGPRDAVLVSFRTPDAVNEVRSFYREVLGKRGFRELPVEKAAQLHTEQLEFVADERSWRLYLSQSKHGTAVSAHGGNRVVGP